MMVEGLAECEWRFGSPRFVETTIQHCTNVDLDPSTVCIVDAKSEFGESTGVVVQPKNFASSAGACRPHVPNVVGFSTTG